MVEFQHGLRKGRSCETQLITVLDDISKWRDDVRNVDDVLIMDRSKYTTSSRKTEGAQWELKVGDMRVVLKRQRGLSTCES